ncbi:MAG: choline/carnitine O-acyltransferase [Campylobacteraceae bacterium]|nr:choline/carnitine O-acyltransferase [Campylobacteraceae bacterium]
MSKTFEFQEQLTSLPLSNLNEASINFLDWVEPLVTQDQFNITKKNLERFLIKDGPILEKKLIEWSAQNEGNWLAPLWKDMYLDIRDPLVIDVNYFIKLITNHLKVKYTSIDIAGVIINKLMDIYESIESETFEVEKARDIPMCMSQYKQMFKATRIPKENRDEYIVKAKSKNNHIIVMFKNNMIKVNLSDASGKKYSCKMIINTLNNILNSKIQKNDTSIGLITTAPRDQAYVVLNDILKIEKNKESFEILKDALFVVCIDESSKTSYDFAMSLMATNENNRYFDKSLQLIFNEEGDFGFNLEHTGADASAWINVINKINEELNFIDKYIEDKSLESIQTEELTWELSETVNMQLHLLKRDHHTRLENIHLEINHFENFGAKKIKSLKYSPDAFLHLSLQLAQYRTFNKLRSTYEAANMRTYLNGRTECNRPISNEVLDFVKAFDSDDVDSSKLKDLMGSACQKHSSRIKDCLGSNGVERYFFAMNKMYTLFSDDLDLKEKPSFFEDEGYKELTYSFISTSRIESKHFDLCGFGPVVPDGYGFWYNLLENQIDMNLTTRKDENIDNVKVFGDAIVKALNDLAEFAS